MKKDRVYAVILTGGKGVRVARGSSTSLPKQFLKILGKPVFMHCLTRYLKMPEVDEVLLVMNPRYEGMYDALLRKYRLDGKVRRVKGGKTRLISAGNALEHIEGPGIVVLQNGNSPATCEETIRKCIRLAKRKKAVTAYIPAFFTTFEIGKKGLEVPLKRGKTGYTCDPQAYDVQVLKKALDYARKRGIKESPTVELVRKTGRSVHLVESGMENVKITTRADLAAAEAVLKERSRKGK